MLVQSGDAEVLRDEITLLAHKQHSLVWKCGTSFLKMP